ncbi:MAG: MBL fold metallo-hydrolase [Planctomycetes bacterium]|nr:MBL fold metallo-hydrolase [Planctomycetota bacterium]
MEWIVLGSGTAVSRGPRSPAGYAARLGSAHLVFDTGPAKLLRMGEAGISFERLTDIFYTHLHPDHVADLVAILFARNNPGVECSERLTLWGPEALPAHLESLRAAHGRWVEARHYRLEALAFPGEARGEADGHPWRVSSRPVAHTPGALGYRLEADGRALAYSGDTGPCPGIVALCRDVDLAVLECSFPDEEAVEGHLSPGRCGRIAREAGARRLLLTHLYPACEALDVAALARREFDGEVLVAGDLMRVAV